MPVGLAADHGGFELKAEMGRTLRPGKDVAYVIERLSEAADSNQEARG